MLKISLVALIVSGFAAIVACDSTQAQGFTDLSLVQVQRQLNAILETRRAEEKEYISTVIKLVREDKIPIKLIYTSFKYVLNKKFYAKSRFVYFVRVLQFQGARDKIEIPKFDFSIYSTEKF